MQGATEMCTALSKEGERLRLEKGVQPGNNYLESYLGD